MNQTEKLTQLVAELRAEAAKQAISENTLAAMVADVFGKGIATGLLSAADRLDSLIERGEQIRFKGLFSKSETHR